MSQFMPDLPMSSQRPVRTFAVGGSVSNEDINKYIQGVLSSGVSQQEAAKQINAAAAQYGVSRDQIAGATGYGLDMVNQYLGAPAAAAPPPTSSTATPPSYFAAPATSTATPATSTAVSNEDINKYIQGVLSSGVSQQEAAKQINAAAAQYGVSRDQIAGATGYGLDVVNQYLGAPAAAAPPSTFDDINSGGEESYYQLVGGRPNTVVTGSTPTGALQTVASTTNAANTAPTGAPTGAVDTVTSPVTAATRQSNFEQGVRDWFAANPNATLDQVNAAIAKEKGSYDPLTKTFTLDGMTYKYANAPGYSQQQFQSIVDDYLANTPGLTYQQVQSQAQKHGLDYNPYTGKVTYGDITYTTRGPRVSQQEFQSIVDDYFRKNPNATGEDAAKVAASIGGEYNPFTQTVKVGDLSYKTPLGAGATSNQFQSLVDKYLLDIKGLNYTGEDLVRDAKGFGGDYDPFTKTVTYKGYTYKVPEAPDPTFNQFKGVVDKYLLDIKGLNYTGEDLVRDAKGFGGDYNPFTKTVTYKGYTYKAPEAPGPTLNQFKGVIDKYLTDVPDATAADLYLAAKAQNFNYDPFTKQVSFGDLVYSPQGIKGYLNVPPDSVIVDQGVVNRYRLQLNELNALAENNKELQPLADRAKQIYDAVLARLSRTQPPPVVTELPPIDSRPVIPLPGRTQPDANFRSSPPRVWNQLLGAFTYAPPASVSLPNPRETAGAVAPGQGESWTPPVVTSRPRTLLNVRQNEIDPATGRPRYTAGFDSETGIFTAPVSRSSQAASDRSRAFAGLNAAMAGKKYTTPEYYSFLANVRGGAYGNPTDPDFASKVKSAVDAYYASKPTS